LLKLDDGEAEPLCMRLSENSWLTLGLSGSPVLELLLSIGVTINPLGVPFSEELVSSIGLTANPLGLSFSEGLVSSTRLTVNPSPS
jgi:hypothetical protein